MKAAAPSAAAGLGGLACIVGFFIVIGAPWQVPLLFVGFVVAMVGLGLLARRIHGLDDTDRTDD